jgi:hypothetical protein
MLTRLGFKQGDEFKVKKRGDNVITLKKVGAETEAETEKNTED